MAAFSLYRPLTLDCGVRGDRRFDKPLTMTLDGIMGGGKTIILEKLKNTIGEPYFHFFPDAIDIERQCSNNMDLLDMKEESIGFIEKVLLDSCADRYMKMFFRVSGWDSDLRYLCDYVLTERSIFSFVPFIQSYYQSGIISQFCFEWLKKSAEKYQLKTKFRPKFVIFLDMPVKTAWGRYQAKNPNPTFDESFFRRLRQNLINHYTNHNIPLCMINVNGDMDKDFAKVHRCVKQLILSCKWFSKTSVPWVNRWVNKMLQQKCTRRSHSC